MFRIISGKWKAKRIAAPKNFEVRPTTDFAKEALFSIIDNVLIGKDITTCVHDNAGAQRPDFQLVTRTSVGTTVIYIDDRRCGTTNSKVITGWGFVRCARFCAREWRVGA